MVAEAEHRHEAQKRAGENHIGRNFDAPRARRIVEVREHRQADARNHDVAGTEQRLCAKQRHESGCICEPEQCEGNGNETASRRITQVHAADPYGAVSEATNPASVLAPIRYPIVASSIA